MKSFFTLTFLLIFPVLARAQLPNEINPPPPDISGWVEVERSSFGVKPLDDVTLYLGFIVKYQNPANPDEFIRVWMRYQPFFHIRRRVRDEGSRQEFLDSRAQAKIEEELKKRREKADPIVYERYFLELDQRTNLRFQREATETWLRNYAGVWRYSRGGEKDVIPYSQALAWDSEKRLTVGQEFRLGKDYHILKMNPNEFLKGGGQ